MYNFLDRFHKWNFLRMGSLPLRIHLYLNVQINFYLITFYFLMYGIFMADNIFLRTALFLPFRRHQLLSKVCGLIPSTKT